MIRRILMLLSTIAIVIGIVCFVMVFVTQRTMFNAPIEEWSRYDEAIVFYVNLVAPFLFGGFGGLMFSGFLFSGKR